jgi:hypothetical protein
VSHARIITISLAIIGLSVLVTSGQSQRSGSGFTPAIPKTWDEDAIAALKVPLANPVGSPKHVSADYYYRIPAPPIYKNYPVYAPGHEPPGYMEWLKQQEPVIVWDDGAHKPPLQTEEDWIKAGEIVFDASTDFDRIVTVAEARDPAWYEQIGVPVAKDGVVPFFQYVVRKKGAVEVGQISCAMCHTRVIAEGAIAKGAQGNFPVVHSVGSRLRATAAQSKDTSQLLSRLRLGFRGLWATPWLKPDPEERIEQMSLKEIIEAQEAFPSGVIARQRTSLFSPAQVPDLIGVKDR